jgi:hypothetical protein
MAVHWVVFAQSQFCDISSKWIFHPFRQFFIKQKSGWQIFHVLNSDGPPLWSSGQSSWLQIQRSGVRFPALPDFLRSSGSGTGSTQPHEDN